MDTEQLAEQQILRYQSRMRHLDEMIEKARKGLDGHPEKEKHKKTLAEILQRRDDLKVKLDELLLKNPTDPEEQVEKAGLMAIWEVLAQDLEALLEAMGL
jgi:hypothetical protein